MKAAHLPRRSGRLVVVDPANGVFDERPVDDLIDLLPDQALVVLNDSGTWPASLPLHTCTGAQVEARFSDVARGVAVLFGAGDWRTSTEQRPRPPKVAVGDTLTSERGQPLTVVGEDGPRLVLSSDTVPLARVLLEEGRPVQYSYIARDLTLAEVQSPIAGAPASSEMPSASRVLSVERILKLRRRGFAVHALQHGAGLSAVGAPAHDATLPWPEHYRIGEQTWRAVRQAKRQGRPVVAVGTTVARALEGATGRSGVTDHVLGAHVPLRVVDAIVTGVHDLDSSHHHLLQAFVEPAVLREANAYAAERGFLGHEFGDFTLVVPGALGAQTASGGVGGRSAAQAA